MEVPAFIHTLLRLAMVGWMQQVGSAYDGASLFPRLFFFWFTKYSSLLSRYYAVVFPRVCCFLFSSAARQNRGICHTFGFSVQVNGRGVHHDRTFLSLLKDASFAASPHHQPGHAPCQHGLQKSALCCVPSNLAWLSLSQFPCLGQMEQLRSWHLDHVALRFKSRHLSLKSSTTVQYHRLVTPLDLL